MKKKLLLVRFTKFGGLILLMMFGLLNAQTIIYQQNFDGNNGTFANALVSQVTPTNGWISSDTSSQNGTNRHIWNFSTLGSGSFAPLSGRSLGMGFFAGNNPFYANSPFRTYNGTVPTNSFYTTRWAHVGISTVGYENITVEFKWRCTGEVDTGIVYDYGTVNTSINGGANWAMDITGGQAGVTDQQGTFTGGLYYNNSGIQTATLTLPANRANQPNFRLAFRMVVDEGFGTGGGFIVDDIIVRGTPISTNKTLTVSNAYPGATYANGVTTFTNNTSVTATSGTRTGYNVTGWTGTGSVPATGTTGSSTFTITQTSTIDWKWQQIGLPNNIVFYNYGTTEQLAFNNSRSDTTTPIFRLSHGTDPATDYQIEINPSSTFAVGTSWTQTFTGAYPLNTQANFTFTNGFSPINNTTYYVRVRVKGAANSYSAWTTETYSFTHDTNYTKPNWLQTTQAQFTTDALLGMVADVNNDVVLAPPTDPIKNGNFATTANWTPTKSYQGTITFPSTDCLNCPGGTTTNLKMFLNGNDAFNGDYMMVSQQVDLTNVDQITYNAASYYATSGSAPGRYSSLKFMIGGTATNIIGDDLHTTNQAFTSSTYSNNTLNDPNVVINTQGYTGIQTIKFVVKFTAQVLGTPLTSFYVNNVKAISTSSGTITSTPIALSSVQNVTRFEKLLWNQTLGGGTLNFKIQQTTLGGTVWTDVAGYTAISATGDGEKEFDLSAMTGYEQIRLVGTLNGANVKMHDWAVIYEEPCDKLWSSTSSTDWGIRTNWIPPGIPTANKCVKIPSTSFKPIISVGNGLAKTLEIATGGGLTINANASLTVTN